MRQQNVWLVAVVLAVLVVAGCSNDPGPPDQSTLPDGAISLTQNQPRRPTIEGRLLGIVATNIDENGAHLSIAEPLGDKPATFKELDIDDTIEFDGITLRLVATWVDPNPGNGDGGDHSKAWVVVENDSTPTTPTDRAPSSPTSTAPPEE